jgi:phospho-N-acetylmuramoyl-pentapeptide-transferase
MSFQLKLFLSMATSLLVSVLIGPKIIKILTEIKAKQSIREDGPASHMVKSGTPTMGGIIFIVALLGSYIFFGSKTSDDIIIIVITLGFGLVGFLDDFLKVKFKRNLGLTAFQKIIGQLIFTSILLLYYMINNQNPTEFWIPFTTGEYINLGILTVPFLLIVILGTVNAVNLTDGLDGLASGTSAIFFLAFTYICHTAGFNNISVICISLVGGLLGFLYFNHHPARIFMGDTGSLALGGAVASIAMLSGNVFLIPIVGAVFFIETLSVIIQVLSFKLTGKRVFKMAPLHHHFEQLGWKEVNVVILFWIVSIIFALIGIFSL